MPNVYQRHAEGVKNVQDYLGDSAAVFTWAGNDYKCFPSSVGRENAMGLGGNELMADLAFIVLADQLTTIPAVDQLITYRSRTYRVKKVQTLPGGQCVRFECNDANQGL